VALARDGVLLAEAAEVGGRATNALGLIEKVLTESKNVRAEIAAIAVGLGPGSYTGIRAAIAVAQGWQLARGIKLLGVNSVDAIAAQAQAEQFFGRVNVVVDAQRDEFYLATWEISSAACREVSPLKIVTAAEMEKRRVGGEMFAGPETGRILFPSAAMVARLAAGRADFVSGENLEPVYLRLTNFIKAPAGRGIII